MSPHEGEVFLYRYLANASRVSIDAMSTARREMQRASHGAVFVKGWEMPATTQSLPGRVSARHDTEVRNATIQG